MIMRKRKAFDLDAPANGQGESSSSQDDKQKAKAACIRKLKDGTHEYAYVVECLDAAGKALAVVDLWAMRAPLAAAAARPIVKREGGARLRVWGLLPAGTGSDLRRVFVGDYEL